ncbi:ParB/RepB/Spo0J family partition protein [Clostridium sp. AN503]|uniref:ParB/RepB/Spo0J family partition protein n=1 Tax=Clostridium sp. AN503 TaxID=3160598 RepID=UPI00345AB634
MADEKPKTLQEQSSPTGPPVSQEVKDTAPAVAQPGEEKDKTDETKAVEVKETEAAGSKKLGDIVKEVKEAQQKQTEASPTAPGKKQSASITKITDLPKTGQKKAEKPEPTKRTAAPKKETKEKPVKPGKSKSTAPVSKGAPGASAPAQAAPTPPEPPKEAPRRGEEQIVYLKLNELHAFKNHPFGVRDDEEMRAMVSSVKDKGVTQPAIVRPLEGGGYEIVSGHRRQKASELAGYTDMPCIVRNLTDDEAITQMVEDNLNQREEILPSEKAKALKMQLEAIKHQGTRTSGHVDPKEAGKRSNEIVAERNKMAVKQVQRFIRLNELVPDLMKLVDDKKIGFTTAVELSYINKKNQNYIAVSIDSQQASPTQAQAKRMRELDEKKLLNGDVIDGIMMEDKKEVDKVILTGAELGKYFGAEATPREMKDQIIKLLDDWKGQQKEQVKPEKKADKEK